MIQRWLAGCVAAVLVLMATVPVSANTAVNLGMLSAHDFDTAVIAQDRGFFAKRGLDVTITRITSVGNIPPSLMSGSIDIGAGSMPVLLQSTDAGLDLQALMGNTRLNREFPTASIIVKKSAGIATPQDLKGKKIAVNALNSIWHLLLIKWLANNKIPLSSVTILEVQLPLMRDVLRGGTVDAVAGVEPFRSTMLSDPDNRDLADFAAEVHNNLNSSIWLAKRDWIAAHKDAVAGFKAAINDAMAYAKSNPDETRAIREKYWKGPVEGSNFNAALSPVDVGFFVTLEQQMNLLQHPVDAPNLIAR